MSDCIRILILEDSVDDVEFIKHRLKKENLSFVARVVETREYYENALVEFKPDVVLSDHSLPMFDSMLALQIFQSYEKIYNASAVFILVTGTVSEEFAVRIMKAGADDYILKDRLKRLPAAISNALEKKSLRVQQREEHEEKMYLSDIVQRSFHEIYVVNTRDFQFEYANKQALKNLGYRMDEITALTPSEILRDFDKPTFLRTVACSEKRAQGLLIERWAVRKDGSQYPVQIHLQVIEHKEEKKILANVLDISEAKELEEEKARQQDAIGKQNKKLAEIAWEQSHVVRAPLTRLLACVEYLEGKSEEEEKIFTSIKNSALEIDQIIRKIIQKSEQVEVKNNSGIS